MAAPRSHVGYAEGDDWGDQAHSETKLQNRKIRDELDRAHAAAIAAGAEAGDAAAAVKAAQVRFFAACARCREVTKLAGAADEFPELDHEGILAVAASWHMQRLAERPGTLSDRRLEARAAMLCDGFSDWPPQTIDAALARAHRRIDKHEAARLAGVSWAVKAALSLGHFGAIDVAPDDYHEKEAEWRREKHRESNRKYRARENEKKKRLPPKVKEPDPWKVLGVSRATYFRQRAADEAKNLTSDVALKVLAEIKNGPATAATVAASCDLKVATVRAILAAAEERSLVARFGRGFYRTASPAPPAPVQGRQGGVPPERRAEIARAIATLPRRLDGIARAVAAFRMPVVNLPPERSPPRRRSA